MAAPTQFIGVYSSQNSADGEKSKKKELFFVWQQYQKGLPSFLLQEIDGAFTPCGKLRRADKSTIDLFFKFEPNILAQPISQPDLSSLEEPKARDTLPPLFPPQDLPGQKPQKPLESTKPSKEPPKETPAAPPLQRPQKKEPERPKPVVTGPRGPVTSANFVARAQEKLLRNSFEEAFEKLHMPEERTRALKAIKKIADQKKGIVPEHKHMFRDFSVTMRKEHLPEIALQFASRSVDLAPNDDHAHFNLARIFMILARYDDAIKELNKALELPITEDDGHVYKKLLRHVERERERHREEIRRRFS